jgi:tRNA A64-2'-O-ribosylphosphate transferase
MSAEDTAECLGGKEKLHVLQRRLYQANHSLSCHLLSIRHDADIVQMVSEQFPGWPVIANLRNGLWYAKSFHSTCYFKSTDGHNIAWKFSDTRLNLDTAKAAATNGGCVIVDSTRRG